MAVWKLPVFAVTMLVIGASCGRNATSGSAPSTSSATAPAFAPARICQNPGTFHERMLEVDGIPRHFLLHVPRSFRCGTAIPLLVDFHGTTALPTPEEDLLTAEAIGLADQRGFILARPRSFAGPVDGEDLYQWDVNAGDLERNAAFVHALVGRIANEYTVDPARTYALGFSNGSNMAAWFLGDTKSPFRGYAVVGGGAWTETEILPRNGREPRLYATTGYRDYMYEWHTTLMQKWQEGGYSQDSLFVRAHHGGHELYAWQYREAWDWLDQGKRPDRGHLKPDWDVLSLETSDDLLAVTHGRSGLLVAGANGFLAREERGKWVFPIESAPAMEPITDLCLRADGVGLAVGDRRYAYTRDAGRSWVVDSSPPEFFGDYLGTSHLLGAACGRRLIAGGYWTGVVADEPFGPWNGSAMVDSDEVPEHVSDITVADDGNVIVVGEAWIGRSLDEGWTHFTLVDEPHGWMYGVARAGAEHFWVVGDRGQLRFSNDDGWNWQTVRDRESGPDLYAVHFADATHGAVVGAGGTVLATHNGGLDWFEIPTGRDHFLGGVVSFTDGSIVVAGEDGFLARWRPSGPVP